MRPHTNEPRIINKYIELVRVNSHLHLAKHLPDLLLHDSIHDHKRRLICRLWSLIRSQAVPSRSKNQFMQLIPWPLDGQ